MKGIVLAGGSGTRLWPITHSTSKQLMPIYDKPMIYYPIATLMQAGIKEFLIIVNHKDKSSFFDLLGDGSNFGIEISYEIQSKPEGIAQALIIAENFLNGEACMLILGDNIFHGLDFKSTKVNSNKFVGAHIFTYTVSNPSSYGILTVEKEVPISILEKPKFPKSNLAITGLYSFDNTASNKAKLLTKSSRGEYEITDLLEIYMRAGQLSFEQLPRGSAWLDTGTVDALNDATTYVRVIEERTGLKIACLEEIALSNNWIAREFLEHRISILGESQYANYLKQLIK